MKVSKFLFTLATAVAVASSAYAADVNAQRATQSAGASAMVMTAGQVRKVDTEQGKVTIQHEPITNLDMPAMTMVFRAEKDVLNGINPGDKVQFHAENRDGGIVVTHIQAQK